VAVNGAGLRSYGALLAAILAAFAIQGIAEPGRWELALVTALLGVTLLLSLRIASVRPAILGMVRIIALGLIAFSFAEALTDEVNEQAARLANALLVTFAPPAILMGVIRKLRQTQTVTVEAVIGVLCVYVLLGMFYSFLYGVVDRFGDTQFFAGGQGATVARCLYFSFTTLSTVGYGDLTAATNLGHTLAVSEALFGQVYLVTVVSLIVGNLGRQRRRDA
jgi:type III secretory pathway component EscS